jgi:hypothetical protein
MLHPLSSFIYRTHSSKRGIKHYLTKIGTVIIIHEVVEDSKTKIKYQQGRKGTLEEIQSRWIDEVHE